MSAWYALHPCQEVERCISSKQVRRVGLPYESILLESNFMELIVFVFILKAVYSTMIGVGLVAFFFSVDRAIYASPKNQKYLRKVTMLVPIGLVGLIAVILAA